MSYLEKYLFSSSARLGLDGFCCQGVRVLYALWLSALTGRVGCSTSPSRGATSPLPPQPASPSAAASHPAEAPPTSVLRCAEGSAAAPLVCAPAARSSVITKTLRQGPRVQAGLYVLHVHGLACAPLSGHLTTGPGHSQPAPTATYNQDVLMAQPPSATLTGERRVIQEPPAWF